jgi:hypothetical protein
MMLGFDRIFRGLASGAAVAALAAAPAWAQTAPMQPLPARTGSALTAPTLPRPVALTVTWPKVMEVERMDGNGVSFYGGVASIDGSDQYGLSVLTFDPFQSSVRATYIDAWALNAPDAASCSLTFRAVDRPLTQDQANALAPELAGAELQTIQKDHPDLIKSGERTREGTDVVRVVDRFRWTETGKTFDGLSKSWIFVRLGRAYYVNKICLSQTGLPDLTVMDQLIGLTYRTGDAPAPAPGDLTAESPPTPRRLIYLPPPVGNIVARAQDKQALESQTLDGQTSGVETEIAAAAVHEPATTPHPVPPPVPAVVAPEPEAPRPVALVVEAAPAPVPPPAPAPIPAAQVPAPDQTVARGLTQSLNGAPPAS